MLSMCPTRQQVAAMTPTQRKVYTNRVRRIAARQRLTVRKSRRRDPRAHDFDVFWLVTERGKVIVTGHIREIHLYLLRG
jgi:hypothetical protein